MNVEAGSSQIPEYLRPLYEAKTAGKSINKAIELLRNVSDQKLKEIIKDPAFGAIVRSALNGSDQYRQKREERLFKSVDEENYDALFEAIYPFSNS